MAPDAELAELVRDRIAALASPRGDAEALGARVCAILGDDAEPAAALATLALDDLWLAHAALAGDAAATTELDRRLRAQVAGVVRGLRESRGFADELEVNLLAHVLVPRDGAPPRLANYTGRGALDGWLRVTATREALAQRRRAARDAGDDGELDQLAALGSPEVDFLAASYRDKLRAAFRVALAKLDDRQQNLIRLHYRDGVGVEALGQMYRVHFSTISRWIAAARAQLFADTRDEVRAQLGVGDAEFAELMALVQSRLDITISLFVR